MSDVVEIPAEYQFVREPWRDHAACDGVNSDLFFPERGEPTEPAKAICFGCPVKTECLTWALDHFVKIGVYGGRSERERRRMRKERRATTRRGEVYVILAIDEEPKLPALRHRRAHLRPTPGLAASLGLAPVAHRRPQRRRGATLSDLLRAVA